jgi:hypothetical protein
VWGVPARPLKQHLRALANLARVEQLRRDVHRLLQGHRERAAR